MKLRIGSITFLLFLSSVAISTGHEPLSGQTITTRMGRRYTNISASIASGRPMVESISGPRSRLTHPRCSQAELFGTDCD